MVQGFFWVMSEDLGIFLGPEFCLHSIIPVIYKPEYPPWAYRTIEANSVGKAWEEWLEGIERELRYFKIAEAVDKKDAIIIYGGKEIGRLEKSLPDPEIEDVYEKLRTKLNNHFTPKKSKHHARYLFLKMRPYVGETTGVYAARLRENAEEYTFWR